MRVFYLQSVSQSAGAGARPEGYIWLSVWNGICTRRGRRTDSSSSSWRRMCSFPSSSKLNTCSICYRPRWEPPPAPGSERQRCGRTARSFQTRSCGNSRHLEGTWRHHHQGTWLSPGTHESGGPVSPQQSVLWKMPQTPMVHSWQHILSGTENLDHRGYVLRWWTLINAVWRLD